MEILKLREQSDLPARSDRRLHLRDKLPVIIVVQFARHLKAQHKTVTPFKFFNHTNPFFKRRFYSKTRVAYFAPFANPHASRKPWPIQLVRKRAQLRIKTSRSPRLPWLTNLRILRVLSGESSLLRHLQNQLFPSPLFMDTLS